MSRYKKIVMNEVELKEIGGQKALLKPSVEDKFKALELVKDIQMEKDANLIRIRTHLTDVLFKSIHVFDGNKPTDKLLPGEETTTKEDIDSYVVDNLMELWTEYLITIDILTAKKVEELTKKVEETKKKQEMELLNQMTNSEKESTNKS